MPERDRLAIVHMLRSPVGGVFRHVRDLIDGQTSAGHDVGLVCDAAEIGAHEGRLLDALAPRLRLGLHRVAMGRAVGPADVVAATRLAAKLAPLKPDVLHGHGAKGGFFARGAGLMMRAFGARPARFYAPHGGSLHFPAKSLEGRVYFTTERMLERATESLVFVSRFEAETYAAKVGTPRCGSVLVYNGLGAAEFEPIPADADAADFVVVGEMRHLKGTDVFLNALARLVAEGRDVSAEVIGPGTERPAYEALARDLGLGERLRFRDSMPIRAALARGRIAVAPSRAESLPYVVLETIAAGRPLLTTRVGGIPEIFAGDADRLLPPGEVAPLATAMGAALDDPTGLAEAAARLRSAIRPVFSLSAMTERIEETYRRHRAGSRSHPSPSDRGRAAVVERSP